MSNLKYTSTDEQIKKLLSQKLIISDEVAAMNCIDLFGYTNLIKSYRDPYIVTSEHGIVYRSDVTFDQIYSLYTLDKNLRIAVMASMLDLEEHIKAIAADVIAKSFGVHQDTYLTYRNYQNKKKYKYRFTLTGILDTLKKTLDTDKEPIHHHMSKYGVVPPWVLFKSIYFSTIINFIDQFKSTEQREMVHKLYDIPTNASDDDYVKLMMDTLYVALEYRNMAAHGGRIYNYQCNRELHFDFGKSAQLRGFSLLLYMLNSLKYQAPYRYLEKVLDRELNRHCNLFPQDVTYLGQILNLNISSHQMVWVTEKSKKYHSTQHCSGIKNATAIDLENAQKIGFTACKKCC